MAPTPLTVKQIALPFAELVALGFDFVWTAGNAVDGNTFVCTGKEIILVQNSDGVNPYTVKVEAVNDAQNRLVDFGPYTLAAGVFSVLPQGLTNKKGWIQADQTILLTPSNAAIKFCILRLPVV